MFTSLYAKIVILLLIIAAIAVASCGIVRHLFPKDRSVDRTVGPYAVKSADSGASLTYLCGPLKRRSESINLPNVSAPAEGEKFFEESKANLELIAGGSITIHETKSKRLDRFEPDDVFNSTGQCLQLSQLKAGWVWCLSNAPKAYKQAQSEASKANRGIWKDFKGWKISSDGRATPLYEYPRPMTDEEFEAFKEELRKRSNKESKE